MDLKNVGDYFWGLLVGLLGIIEGVLGVIVVIGVG